MTDRLGLIGSVNAVERVALAGEKIHGPGAQRIVGSRRYAVGIFGKLGPPHDHVLGRRPLRPLDLAAYLGDSRPVEAPLADRHAVADRITLAQDIVEGARAGIDDDRARLLAARPPAGFSPLLQLS